MVDIFGVLDRTSYVSKANPLVSDDKAKWTVSPANGHQEMNDDCFRVVDKALCANEHGVLLVNSLWLFMNSSTPVDDWHRAAAGFHEGALNPWNLPLLDPVLPVTAKVVVFPLHSPSLHHWSALVWYRLHEATHETVVLHHYDSVPNCHHEWAVICINEWLAANRQLFFAADRPPGSGSVELVTATHYPLQDEGHSCGFRVATLVDLLVERARRGVFSPIDTNDKQLVDSHEFNARRHRLFIALHKRLRPLLPDFPKRQPVSEEMQRATLADTELVHGIYRCTLGLDSDVVDALALATPPVAVGEDDDNDDEAGSARTHLLPVVAVLRDLDTAGADVFGGLLPREEFLAYMAKSGGAPYSRQEVAACQRRYRDMLQQRYELTVLMAISPRTPRHAECTFGYPWLALPDTLWRYCALAVELVHRVRLWAHDLWLDIRANPTRTLAEQQAYNRRVLEDAAQRHFAGVFSDMAQTSYAIHNLERFAAGMRRILKLCMDCRRQQPQQALDFGAFLSMVTCTLVCGECVAVAPVRIRCSSATFGPHTPAGTVLCDEVLGLAMLWRASLTSSTHSHHHHHHYLDRVHVSHPAAPRTHSVQATLWNAFRVDNSQTPLNTHCSGQQDRCFWRFVCNDAPEPSLTWPELVAQGLCTFYSPPVLAD